MTIGGLAMNMKVQKFSAVAILMLLSACCTQRPANPATFEPQPPASQSDQRFDCPEKRPEVCTFEFAPVCATRDTGVRCVTTPCPSTEQATYSNGCTACADNKVISYQPGACGDTARPAPAASLQ